MNKLYFALLLLFFSIEVLADNQERSLPSFNEIDLCIDATVYVEQGDSQKISITASKETLEIITTEVKENRLIISFPFANKWSKKDPGNIAILIVVPDIAKLYVTGSGAIIGEKELRMPLADLSINGSGKIRLADLVSESVITTISGSGDIVITGSEQALDLKTSIMGTGNIRAGNFPVKTADIKISGSGMAILNVQDKIEAKVIGTGSIRYYGDPEIKTSGSSTAKIKKMSN